MQMEYKVFLSLGSKQSISTIPVPFSVSGCSCPTHHRSPTRSESSEAFSPESASKSVKNFF